MRRAISGKLAKKIDVFSIERGMPSLVLMERAALKVAEHTARLLETEGGGRILFVCSEGNNGADGIAAARILTMEGNACSILFTGKSGHATAEFATQLKLAQLLDIPMFFYGEDIQHNFFDEYTIIVDAMFGIGLSRTVEGRYAAIIDYMNGAGKKLLSVDIPSGVNSANGQIMGVAVNADVTVTFGYAKLGHMLYPGKKCTGKLYVEEIGFLPFDFEAYKRVENAGESAFYFAGEDDFRISVPVREKRSNKGNYGKPLIIAGSKDMTGAAFMSGLAAYRTGAGVVTVLTHESVDKYLKSVLPEAIVRCYGDEPEKAVTEALEGASIVVVGPGMGVSRLSKRVVACVLANSKVPVIVDADALNIISEDTKGWLGEEGTGRRSAPLVVTPHVGEMGRLSGHSIKELAADIPYYALEFANRYGVYCVLKDAVSAVASPDNELFITTCGNPGMATAGAGDVLTGILAAVNSWTKESFFERLCVGVQLHAMAGDMAAEKLGEHAVMARDIIECIPRILRS